ncbi:MAG: 6-carboxytetrahydropterin synthase [Opitutales bacterium]|nr:6-carboxytetrahydropterin synthase [Opitutales bacterium]
MLTADLILDKEDFKFSAGHFTIFSERDRENLHGHNFRVRARVECALGENGMAFDYNVVKRAVRSLCAELDEIVLLPGKSPHMEVTETPEMVVARFADERLVFLPRDVKVLPLPNITVECLAAYLADRLSKQLREAGGESVGRVQVGVSSGPGQTGEVTIPSAPRTP